MSVKERASELGVEEIVHFTTDLGLMGAMAVGALLPRSELTETQLLKYIIKMNAIRRWDTDWFGYVNLSVSRINLTFFTTSTAWHAHPERWWTILAFEPSILDQPGVTFSTTNNGYPSTQRSTGVRGFDALFGNRVLGKHRALTVRDAALPKHFTTDIQAEVLYPGQLPLDRLCKIYFQKQDHVHYFESLCTTHKRPELSGLGVVDPSKFYASQGR